LARDQSGFRVPLMVIASFPMVSAIIILVVGYVRKRVPRKA
jgi:hypothetical protein